MRTIILMLCFLMFGCAVAFAKDDGGLRLIDLTDDYARIWTDAQRLPEGQSVAYFERSFAPLLPGFYDAARFAQFGTTPEAYDAALARKLQAYPEKRAGIARVSAQFNTLFQPARKRFEQAFGPMRGYPPIYLVNAHGEFDGGTRDLPRGMRLLFGADVIDAVHGDKPIEPFFHHELFHLLHARTFRECAQLWCGLWAEGLATYVAAQLNPEADDEALLLTVPEPLRPAVEQHRREALCAVLARFDSEKMDDYGPLFVGGSTSLSVNLPPRFGYYVGFLVAQDLGRDRSLKDLAALTNAQAQPLVHEALNRLGGCDRAQR